jgi:Icc-related predicted phosphoesterase
MTAILDGLGPVDVLCTHVPPAVPALRTDVITGREERGSEPIGEYLRRIQPIYHLFGDVHQPQASTWRVGRTRCVNAGYFRATGRYLRLDDAIVHIGSIR